MFLENWKRLQMRLGYFWDLTGIEEEEVSSPASFSVSALTLEIDYLEWKNHFHLRSLSASPRLSLMVAVFLVWLCGLSHGGDALKPRVQNPCSSLAL